MGAGLRRVALKPYNLGMIYGTYNIGSDPSFVLCFPCATLLLRTT